MATKVRSLWLVADRARFPCNERALLARCPTHIQSMFNLIVSIYVMFNWQLSKMYPLTSVICLYRWVKCTTHCGEVFFIDQAIATVNKWYYRVFSLTLPASMQIDWNQRKRLYKKRVQLPEDWSGTPTWPPFRCFGTPIWPPWRHVKTLDNNLAISPEWT